MVDGWWRFVCPSDKGSDDPWINPFADGSPNLEGLECERVIITVAERDILREKGKMYYEKLVNSNWRGNAEIMETKGKDHVFHIFEPDCDEAKGDGTPFGFVYKPSRSLKSVSCNFSLLLHGFWHVCKL